MLNLIKIILIVISMLTSNKMLALKADKEPKIPNNIDPEDVADAIVIFGIFMLQLSFYLFIIYWDEKKKKQNETDVDKIDETHMEEQHSNELDN